MQDSSYHCEHPKVELRQRTYSNSSIHYVEQCLRCGMALRSHKHDSNRVAQAKLHGAIPAFDETLQDEFLKLAMSRSRNLREDQRADWWQWYTEYLKTPKWAAKRTACLRRDQYICQGCRNHRATQVHHLTYAHAGDEFLFELISLCINCHDRIHPEHNHGKDNAGPSPQLSR